MRERKTNDVVGVLIESRFAPVEKFDVSISVNIVSSLGMTVVSDPALVRVVAASPSHQPGLAAPSVVNTMRQELNPLITINVTMRDIKSKNVYSRVNSKATTQWRKTESANGVHLEVVASDNRSS